MPRDNGLDGTYLRREKQKKEKSVKVAKSNEKVSKVIDILEFGKSHC